MISIKKNLSLPITLTFIDQSECHSYTNSNGYCEPKNRFLPRFLNSSDIYIQIITDLLQENYLRK